MKSTIHTPKNIGETVLAVAAVPVMLVGIAVWALVTFGKMAVSALFYKHQNTDTVRSR